MKIIVRSRRYPTATRRSSASTASYDADGFCSRRQQNDSGDLAPGRTRSPRRCPAGWALSSRDLRRRHAAERDRARGRRDRDLHVHEQRRTPGSSSRSCTRPARRRLVFSFTASSTATGFQPTQTAQQHDSRPGHPARTRSPRRVAGRLGADLGARLRRRLARRARSRLARRRDRDVHVHEHEGRARSSSRSRRPRWRPRRSSGSTRATTPTASPVRRAAERLGPARARHLLGLRGRARPVGIWSRQSARTGRPRARSRSGRRAVTCVSRTRRTQIVVEKQTDPDGDAQVFSSPRATTPTASRSRTASRTTRAISIRARTRSPRPCRRVGI